MTDRPGRPKFTAPAREPAEAPSFELPDQHGASVSLTGLRLTGSVVVIFFPYAHTAVCTSELRAVQEALPEFRDRGATPVAISCDSMFTQRVFAESEGLTFPLLSDFWPHGTVASAYGAFDAERGCALRGTFVVSPDGMIQWSVVNDLPDARSLQDILRHLP